MSLKNWREKTILNMAADLLQFQPFDHRCDDWDIECTANNRKVVEEYYKENLAGDDLFLTKEGKICIGGICFAEWIYSELREMAKAL